METPQNLVFQHLDYKWGPMSDGNYHTRAIIDAILSYYHIHPSRLKNYTNQQIEAYMREFCERANLQFPIADNWILKGDITYNLELYDIYEDEEIWHVHCHYDPIFGDKRIDRSDECTYNCSYY